MCIVSEGCGYVGVLCEWRGLCVLWLFVLFYPLCGDMLVVSFMCIGWVACVVGVMCPVVVCLCVFVLLVG